MSLSPANFVQIQYVSSLITFAPGEGKRKGGETRGLARGFAALSIQWR